jgi:serine phosphatase RsbU (regulator of sigma subunit)
MMKMSDDGRYQPLFDDTAMNEFVRSLEREVRGHAAMVHHDLLDQNARMHERIVELKSEVAQLNEQLRRVPVEFEPEDDYERDALYAMGYRDGGVL